MIKGREGGFTKISRARCSRRERGKKEAKLDDDQFHWPNNASPPAPNTYSPHKSAVIVGDREGLYPAKIQSASSPGGRYPNNKIPHSWGGSKWEPTINQLVIATVAVSN